MFYVVLDIKPNALCMLRKHSPNSAISRAQLLFFKDHLMLNKNLVSNARRKVEKNASKHLSIVFDIVTVLVSVLRDTP